MLEFNFYELKANINLMIAHWSAVEVTQRDR